MFLKLAKLVLRKEISGTSNNSCKNANSSTCVDILMITYNNLVQKAFNLCNCSQIMDIGQCCLFVKQCLHNDQVTVSVCSRLYIASQECVLARNIKLVMNKHLLRFCITACTIEITRVKRSALVGATKLIFSQL